MRPIAAALLVLLSSAAAARAQTKDTPAPLPAEQEAEAAEAGQAADQDELFLGERPHIQVLQHPYDISSFYRSSQESGTSELGYAPEETGGRYPIASFYRAGSAASGRYSRFWTSGYGSSGTYGTQTHQRGRGQGLIGHARPRALGLNGDLMLFAPTFLAPVGPLTGVFFER
jgi:hypothetical protein